MLEKMKYKVNEAAGNGRNETELHFTHIRFLYDM